MMISQSALLCLEATVRRMFGRAVPDALTNAAPPIREVPERLIAPVSTVSTGTANRKAGDALSDEPQPVVARSEGVPLTPSERRARAAALRALAMCRGRRFDAARLAFVEAARLDPALDLTRTPDFWKLERGAHEAAIAAYVDAGRDGDAAVLRARVHSTYRPKALRARPGAALTP